jgi:hypothetical protein
LRPALALGKQANRVRADERASQIKESVERGERPGGYDIHAMRRHRGDAAAANRRIGGGNARRLAQKRGLAGVGLDKLDPWHAEDRQYETGEAGAAAEIDQGFGAIRDERA